MFARERGSTASDDNAIDASNDFEANYSAILGNTPPSLSRRKHEKFGITESEPT